MSSNKKKPSNFYQISDQATQSQQTRRNIIRHNRRLMITDPNRKHQIIQKSVRINLPKISFPQFRFVESFRAIPKLPSQNPPGTSFYNRNFRFLYVYVGRKNSQVWQKFRQAYEELVPKQHRPLENMVDPQNLQKLVQKLRIFIKSGIQLRILVEKDSYKLAKQTLELLINCEQILQVTIESQQRINLQKSKTIMSLKKLFEDQIKRLIKISTKKKVSLQYNFISMEAKSSEISHRRILLQQCIKPKQPYEYLQTHKKFTNMMKNYENQKLLHQIDKILQEQSSYSTKNKTDQITRQKQKIKLIQKQQQQFCKWFQTNLSKSEPIQLQKNNKQILFKLIDIYKQQTSIYEVINTNIRLSINVNQTNMKCLSTMIKYLYEGIRYFFIHLKEKFQYKVVYRGCRMSDEEFAVLANGTIVMNLGFMSTSWEERIATNPLFLPTDGSGCELIIDIGKQEMESEEDQEGFACIPHIYKQMNKANQKFENQKEVLFNPLNIFQVVKTQIIKKIDQQNEYNIKIVHLRYSPHIRLANKIKSNTITPQELKKYNLIKSNITSLTRTSYDRGKLLHLKGESTKALEHYKQVEETKGETLTIEQQFNKIEILNQIKDFDEMDKCLNKLIKSYEQKVEQIKNPQSLTSEQKKQSIIQTINLLTKQSQILQMSSNYLQAEQRAEKALQQTKALSKQMLDAQKITDKQFIQTLMLDIKSTVLLAKSKSETNDIENSLIQSYDGLKIVEEVYKRYEQSILPKISKLVRQADIPESKSTVKLSEIRRERKREILHKDLKNQLKRIRQQKISNKTDLKNSVRDSNLGGINTTIQKYLKSQRKSKEALLQTYYPACKQIQQVQKNSSVFKLAKNALLELKQFLNQVVQCQNQFYLIIKKNFRQAKQDLRLCLENQRRILEHRYGKFEQFDKILAKNQNAELNTQDIKNYNVCASFLLEYTTIIESKQSQKLKGTRTSILRYLNKKILRESTQNSINLTAQKTLILQSQSQQFKNTCYDTQIIQNQSNKLKNTGLRSTADSIKTISSFKSRYSFDQLKGKLDQLEKIHQADNQINKIYFLLKDINDYLELLNNSYSVAASTEEYNSWLAQANKKAQAFGQKYDLMKMKINETLVKHYYLKAQTQLKRGYYKQAQIFLAKAQDFLQIIYQRKINNNKQVQNKKTRADRLAKLKANNLNKLFAREITIQCYRLEAELYGIYYGQLKRKQFLEELLLMKTFVLTNAPNKIITQALIHQAVAFLALRCLTPKIVFAKNLERQCYRAADQSLNQSIQLRKGLFGNQNEYIAIAYSNLATLQKTKSKPDRSQMTKYYKAGMEIYHSLADKIPNQKISYLDKQPILYLYRMQLESLYKKMYIDQYKQSLGQTYFQNIDSYEIHRKDMKSLYVAENIMDGAAELVEMPAYRERSQEYLKKCQKEIESIVNLNSQNLQGIQKDDENKAGLVIYKMKSRLYSNFVKFYKKSGNSKYKQKYKNLLSKVDKTIEDNQPRLPSPPSPPKRGFLDVSLDIILEFFGADPMKQQTKPQTQRKKQQSPPKKKEEPLKKPSEQIDQTKISKKGAEHTRICF